MNSEIDEHSHVSQISVIKLADNSREEEKENKEGKNIQPTPNSNDYVKKRKLQNDNVDGETASSHGERSACKKSKNEDLNFHHNETPSDLPSGFSSAVEIYIKKEPKVEPISADENDEPQPSCSGVTNPIEIKPPIKVEKADASSTTSRESCRYGIKCYRRNPMHRFEEAHPGDQDYKRPNYPSPPLGTPDCLYGSRCYRRNPEHFRQFSHPLETNFEMNYRIRLSQRKLQQRQRNQTHDGNQPTSNNTSEGDYNWLDDEEDPFADDDEDEYIPSADDIDEEESDDFVADYDDCDKVEE